MIDQYPRVEARKAISMLTHAVLVKSFEHHAPRLQVIFRENIPEFLSEPKAKSAAQPHLMADTDHVLWLVYF